MQQEHFTLVVAGLGIAGTLGGVVVGNYFQTRGQHQQWRRDNVRQECRELLGQLSVNLFAFIDWNRSLRFGPADRIAANLAKQYDNAVLDLHRNLGSRLLIAIEIKNAGIAKRWKTALESFEHDNDEEKLNAEYERIVSDIVNIGLKV
jgi:hypothetical protein